jgi:putative ABC transport system permease protein
MKRLFRGASRLVMPLGIPLAWKQLAADGKRLITAVTGVAFGIMLMMFQVGLYNGINAMVVLPHENLDGDLFLTSVDWEALGSSRGFTRHRLAQAEALPEVKSAVPLYVGFVGWKNPQTRQTRQALTLAFDPAKIPFRAGAIRDQASKLRDPEAVLFDTLSGSDYGPIPELFESHNQSMDVDVERKHAVVRGLFTMGTTLYASANVVMSDEAYFRYRSDLTRNIATIGVISLKPNAEPEQVAERIRALLPPDVRVLTRSAFIAEEQRYWNRRTPVGFVVGAGLLVGMLVGAIVVYQILYSDVNDHLKEYATLKAIGFEDRFFTVLVMEEALILVLLGILPALAMTETLNYFARVTVNLRAYIAPPQVGFVLLAVGFSCLLAGRLAMKRLRTADPASVF